MNPYPNEDTRTIFILVFTHEHEGVTTKVKIKKKTAERDFKVIYFKNMNR